MKNKLKKLFIVLIVTLITFYSLIQIVYYTRSPIYIVSDSIFYETTIKYQKLKLKYKALLNNKRIKYVIDEDSNGSWRQGEYKQGCNIIFSPYISMLYSINDNSEITNPIISIDTSFEGELYNAKGDYLSSYENLAKLLQDKTNVYLISSEAWPSSIEKAEVFKNAFNNDSLTVITLKGNELVQKAYELVENINKENGAEVVSTGATLLSYFNKIENNINYSLEALQSQSVPINSLHYIIYEDLTPLLEDHSSNIILETKIKNNQEGLINFFLHLWRLIQRQLF